MSPVIYSISVLRPLIDKGITGPVLGGFLVEYAGWKWIFFFLAFIGVVTWVLFFLFVPETLPTRVGNGTSHYITDILPI